VRDGPEVLIDRQQITISQVLEHGPRHERQVAPRRVSPPSPEGSPELVVRQAARQSCFEVRCEIGRYRCVGVVRRTEASAASHIVDSVKRDRLARHDLIEVGTIRRASMAKITVMSGVNKVTASDEEVRATVLDLQRHRVKSHARRNLACICLLRISTPLSGLDHLSGSEGYQDNRCLPDD
jgi:hypothetical protein